MGIFLLWATWAHEYTSETASNPEGVVLHHSVKVILA